MGTTARPAGWPPSPNPNGQTSAYAYFPNAGDRRLQTIHHKYPNGTTLSKFDYTYSAAGDILTWRQQAETDAVQWEYVYDTAGQLLGSEKRSTDPLPAVLQRYVYAYDPGGNRTSEQIDDVVVGATYDRLNRLVSQQPSGPLVFAGTTNEPATVTVGGKPTMTTAANVFRVPVASGTSTVTVVATDSSGNPATRPASCACTDRIGSTSSGSRASSSTPRTAASRSSATAAVCL